jgi:hypothetical protein
VRHTGRMRASRPLASLAATLAAALAGCGGSEAASPRANGGTEGGVREDFVAAADDREPARRGRFVTARVVRRTTLRTAPAGRVLARIGRRTEFGSPRVLAVTGRRGRWLRVTVSERRNGEHGWIRAAAARTG